MERDLDQAVVKIVDSRGIYLILRAVNQWINSSG